MLPGIKLIPYGDLEALKAAITPNTAAFLIEPIQGEAGIVIPPAGFMKAALNFVRKTMFCLLQMKFKQVWPVLVKCLHVSGKILIQICTF